MLDRQGVPPRCTYADRRDEGFARETTTQRKEPT
jgi:hypothetical protein